MKAIAAAIALAVALTIHVAAAGACGFWAMTDREKKLDVGWLINSGEITVTGTDHRVAMMYLDIEAKPPRVAANHQVIFEIRAGKILRYGKVIGAITDGHAIVIAGHHYDIALAPRAITDAHDPHAEWTLAVRHTDGAASTAADAFLTSEHASALCAGMARDPIPAELVDDVLKLEIVARVVFYLAWRELGM